MSRVNHVSFCLNKDANKTMFDRIMIRSNKNCNHANTDDAFTAFYKGDVTLDTVREKVPDEISLFDNHEVLDYMEDVLDLLLADKDCNPYSSIDVVIPGYPIVALKPDNQSKNLILRLLRTWCKRSTSD